MGPDFGREKPPLCSLRWNRRREEEEEKKRERGGEWFLDCDDNDKLILNIIIIDFCCCCCGVCADRGNSAAAAERERVKYHTHHNYCDLFESSLSSGRTGRTERISTCISL